MRRSRCLIVLILLLAAALRLVDLDGMPPGLEHDEVANWLIDRDILAGGHGVYFEEAYGHEAGYHYWQAAAVALIGDHVFGLRLPSVFAGLVGIAISYALSRKLFGETVALINAGLLAVLFWSLFFGRLGVRAISLPAASGLAAWFFWRGGIGERCGSSIRDYALAGLWAGLSLYTYMAARSVPLIFGLFFLYLALFQRPVVRRHRRGLLVFVVVLGLTVAPLGYWLLTNPGAEYRISEINQPLDALTRGDLEPVAQNGLKLLGFFGWRGDPLIRQNVPDRPVFDPLGAVLFYLGLVLALWRWRRPEYAFVVIWLGVSLTPSLVTADAPSSIRCINALVVAGIPVGLAVEEFLTRSQSGKLGRWAVALWLLLVAGGTVRAYWTWGQEEEVRFVWQAALKEAAAALDAGPDPGPVVVGGWTPDSMDPPTMALFLRREDLSLRFVNPSQALLLPAAGGQMVWPSALPLDPLLQGVLDEQGVTIGEYGSYLLSQAPQPIVDMAREPVEFDGEIAFLGQRVGGGKEGRGLLTFWRVGDPVDEPLRILLHLLDGAGLIVGQDDGLGVSAAHWQAGDILVQVHRVEAPAGEYGLRVGLYNPETGVRRLYQGESGPEDTLLLKIVMLP